MSLDQLDQFGPTCQIFIAHWKIVRFLLVAAIETIAWLLRYTLFGIDL
jgi:hypothetical protein